MPFIGKTLYWKGFSLSTFGVYWTLNDIFVQKLNQNLFLRKMVT